MFPTGATSFKLELDSTPPTNGNPVFAVMRFNDGTRYLALARQNTQGDVEFVFKASTTERPSSFTDSAAYSGVVAENSYVVADGADFGSDGGDDGIGVVGGILLGVGAAVVVAIVVVVVVVMKKRKSSRNAEEEHSAPPGISAAPTSAPTTV